jgi:hypothetical protein
MAEEPMAELPAAEIADSGEPMPANVSEEAPPDNILEREEPERPLHEAPPRNVVATPAIQQAIEQIHKINKDLQWVLLEMEKAVETLEEAEVQKYADEREIESLKNAMRQLNRTREALPRPPQGPPQQRHDSRSRHPQRDRRDQRDRRYSGRPQPERRGPQNPEPHPESRHESHEPETHPREEETRREPPQEPEIPV